METKEAYRPGDEGIWTVKNNFPEYYELLDEATGVNTYLKYPAAKLYKGQHIPCRVVRVVGKRPFVEVIEERLSNLSSRVTAARVKGYLTDGQEWDRDGLTDILMSNESDDIIEEDCRCWLYGLVESGRDLKAVRTVLTDFLESSDFLNLCDREERERFQDRLTLVIEFLGYYIKVCCWFSEDTPEKASAFVDGLLESLEKSGYVYHPRKKLQMLACLFSLHPDIMREKIEKLFHAIRSREVKFWQDDPFKLSFIQNLEVFVRATDRQSDRFQPSDRRVVCMIQALALQFLLRTENDDTLFDYNLNKAKLYRYISYLDDRNILRDIDLAYRNLVGMAEKPVYTLQQTVNVPVFAEILRHVRQGGEGSGNPMVYRYEKDNICLTLDGSGIVLKPRHADAGFKNVLPDGLLEWQDIRIMLPKGRLPDPVKGGRANGLPAYRRMWADIERGLTDACTETAAGKDAARSRHLPDAGTEVYIWITEADPLDGNLFYAESVDDFYEGKGTVRMEDIVRYKVNATLRAFRSENGKPLVFRARVKSVGHDGSCRFSMVGEIMDMVFNKSSYGDKVKCFVGSYNEIYRRYIGVTEQGYPISFEVPAHLLPVNRHDVVFVDEIEASSGDYLQGVCCGRSAETYFPFSDAFTNLMREYSEAELDDADEEAVEEDMTEEEEDEMRNSVEVVQVNGSYVLELMQLLDRISVAEEDYVSSYNYLSFARLLARITGDGEREACYRGRMELIFMLDRFAVNDRVDSLDLEHFEQENESLYANNPFILHRFKMLKIVGCLHDGKGENEPRLWEMKNAESDPGLKELAELVLTHNMLEKLGMTRQMEEVLLRIKDRLKVESRSSLLKNYGVETGTVEFKTSLVFPPDNDMKPDLKKQTKNILRSVASLMNSEGGILYLGVNDQGMGVGLESDLGYAEFNGDKDRYKRHICDAVRMNLGVSAADYVHVRFDAENLERDVCIVEIMPCPEGVRTGDLWYVRQNTTTAGMNRKQFKEHNRLRRAGWKVAGEEEAR